MNEQLKVSDMLQEILFLTDFDKQVLGLFLSMSQHTVHVWACSSGAAISPPQVERIEKLYRIVLDCVDELVAEDPSVVVDGVVDRKKLRERIGGSKKIVELRKSNITPKSQSLNDPFTVDQKIGVIRD